MNKHVYPPPRPQSPDALAEAVLPHKYDVLLGRTFLPTREQTVGLLRIVDKLGIPSSRNAANSGPDGFGNPLDGQSNNTSITNMGGGPPLGAQSKVVLGLSTAADLNQCMSSVDYACLHVTRHSPLRRTAASTLSAKRTRYFIGLGSGILFLWWLGLRWIHGTTERAWFGLNPRSFLGITDDPGWYRILASRLATLLPVAALHETLKRNVLPFLRWKSQEADEELFFIRVDS